LVHPASSSCGATFAATNKATSVAHITSATVEHVADPPVALVSLNGAIHGCAEIVGGRVVANLSADGRATVSARTVAEVACRSGFAVGFPIAERVGR
jgi:hypothetical protein